MTLRVDALFRYPLKSAAGDSCESVALDRFGVVDDRRWMIVGPPGSPLTQRELPRLALLRAWGGASGLRLQWEEGPAIEVECPRPQAPREAVVIWGHRLLLPRASTASATWLTERLGTEASLLYMPDDVDRPVNPRYARQGDRTALTDGYPLHLLGSGSMADLNSRLDSEVGIERFRPNIYVEGSSPFEEDSWSEIEIGDVTFRVVKPCPRCAVTTVDPQSGVRGKEPLATLSTYRKTVDGVMFGQNVIHDSPGRIRVGDPVRIISRRDTPAV